MTLTSFVTLRFSKCQVLRKVIDIQDTLGAEVSMGWANPWFGSTVGLVGLDWVGSGLIVIVIVGDSLKRLKVVRLCIC